jgi:hypothetical protein
MKFFIMIWIKTHMHKIYEKSTYFQNSYLLKDEQQKKCHVLGRL